MIRRNGGNEWILLQITKKCGLLILEIEDIFERWNIYYSDGEMHDAIREGDIWN